ncbi:hypothetical protein E2C01_020861 [Portunus trituberculatus]|uniref:Uncharacterized protein n=1 Tax=Portunus trituberculatus TaxID=210409 RepID=A0A5B7E112_PORTR|nr:hypothetical protein [Portunus trituberculatus]
MLRLVYPFLPPEHLQWRQGRRRRHCDGGGGDGGGEMAAGCAWCVFLRSTLRMKLMRQDVLCRLCLSTLILMWAGVVFGVVRLPTTVRGANCACAEPNAYKQKFIDKTKLPASDRDSIPSN